MKSHQDYYNSRQQPRLVDYIPGATAGSLVTMLLEDKIAIMYSAEGIHFREREDAEARKSERMPLVRIERVEKPNGRAYLVLEPLNSYGTEFKLPADYIKEIRVVVH